MGPTHVNELSPERGPWFWMHLWRGKTIHLQARTRNQRYRCLQGAAVMALGEASGVDDHMSFSPPGSQAEFEPDTADCHKCQQGPDVSRVTDASSLARSKVQTLKILFADLAMILCQLLLFINHFRRLMDADCPLRGMSPADADADVSRSQGSPAPAFLNAYPCTLSTASRIAFLVNHADKTFCAAFHLPPGELWVPLVTSVILAQLVALLLMPRGIYMGIGRRTCMVLVGLLPKAASLATFITAPQEQPSSYFSTYLPIEGAITIWQQVIYNYPFWPGIAVLAAHCALTTAICATVAPRLQSAGGAVQLFSATWVITHTYCCAAVAACVALQQHPAAGHEIRGAARTAAATWKAMTVSLCRWWWWLSGRHGHCAGAELKLGPSSGITTPGGEAEAKARAGAVAADSHFETAGCRMLPNSDLQSVGSSVKSGTCCTTSFTASSFSFSSSSLEFLSSEGGSTAGSGSHTAIAAAAQAEHHASISAMGPVAEVAEAAEQLRSKPDSPAAPVARAVVLHSEQQGAGRPISAKLLKMAARVKATMKQSAGPAEPTAPVALSSHPSTCPGVGPPQPYVPLASSSGRTAAAVAPLAPVGAFSLKQPTGLSKWTIVEDQEFQAPASTAVGVASSVEAIGQISAGSSRFRHYRSRVPHHRVHMKIPWAEPDQLPGNFLERLNLALSEGLDCMAVGVSVRAGCIELVFDLVPQAAFDSASDYEAGQSRRRHAQHHRHHHHPRDVSPAAVQRQSPTPVQHPQQQSQQPPAHLDMLVQFGADSLCGGEDDESSDPRSALEEAVLSGLLGDAEPASWIDALHLQPPPGAKVLTQACGRVWISRWDHILRQWIPERAGGIRPSQLPRITQLRPSCVLVHRAPPGSGAGTAAAPARSGGCGAVVRVTVSNGGSTPPAFSARCRGRYLPVVARRVRTTPSDAGSAVAASGGCESDDLLATFEVEMEPEALPRNGLVVVECKVGKLLSNWRPLIVTDDPHLAQELQSLPVRLAAAPGPSSGSFDSAATEATAATAFDQSVSSFMSSLVTQAPSPADGGSGGSVSASATATAASDTEGDAFCWDELHTDLGLWLDYLEVLGLSATSSSGSSSITKRTASVTEPAAADLAVAGPVTGGRNVGPSNGKSSDNRDQNGSKEDAAAAAAAPAQDSLDMGPSLAALYGTEGYRAHMAGIGVSLLEFAVDQGWLHVAGMLVDQMLAAGIPWLEVLRRCSGGLTLLHRAVRSGRGEMVDLVVRLGERQGTPFDWQAVCIQGKGEVDTAAGVEESAAAGAVAGGRAGGGVTPLHLAASLPDGGQLAERILSEYEAACELWASAVDSQGLRPADCARAFGHVHLAGKQWARPADGGDPAQATRPAAAAAAAAAAPSITGEASTITTSSGVMTGTGLAEEVDGGTNGGGSGKIRNAAVRRRRGGVIRSGLAAAAAVLRGLMQLMAAPFVGDPGAEAAYVRAVGAENVLWCCGYLVYQICAVLAVAGRMVKELRAHEMSGMLMYCTPHLISASLLCANYDAWLRLREPLFAAVTISRSFAKLLPVLGLLPYPASANNYLSGGMDVLLEGILPAYFERMRAPFVLPLRALEGLATGLLYRSHHVKLHLAPAGVSEVAYALAWTLGCGVITTALDVSCRRRLAAALGAYSAGARAAEYPRSGWGSAEVERAGREGAMVAPVPAAGVSDGGLKRKKVD
ncbi:hypothetical protein Vretimale_16179 [Volvox reticuliferus]|uniref:Uncharacterized protein n=1 Tax=Volvox reticuliferus TaxID=1737510 RepID=A0A8J4CUT9_9CHLO|nr:hypothetical protein Vretifemale_17005 [Volvox reticuliferus]GIM12944.1 hypothetical protein Vretimale_16179 [Volvox reticuliferus]